MKLASGTPTGSAAGSGTLGSKHGDGVVGERAHRAAGEAGHPATGLRLASRQEAAEGGQRIAARQVRDRQVRRVVHHAHRAGLDARSPAAHLQEPARPDAQEAVASQALAALDRFEQVCRA